MKISFETGITIITIALYIAILLYNNSVTATSFLLGMFWGAWVQWSSKNRLTK